MTKPASAELRAGATAEELLVETLELELVDEATVRIARALDLLAARRVTAPEGAGAEGALVAALAAAQAEFPVIHKSQTGEVRGTSKSGADYSYTYRYADLADVLAAVRPVLARNGLTLTQHTAPADGGRTRLVTELRHVAGASMTTELDIHASTGAPQQFGGSLTYLRRYSVVTLLGLAAEEDTDAQHVEPVTSRGTQAAGPPAPTWAAEATKPRKQQLLKDLEDLIGKDAGVALARATSDTFGHVPDVIVGYTVALAAYYRAVHGKTPAEAAAASAQDVAAEQPDPPAPEPQPDPPAPELTPEQQNAERLRGGRTAKEALATMEADRASAGLATTPADRMDFLVELGCICPDPLAIHTSEPHYSNECVFPDHGISF